MREIMFRGKCLNCQKFKYGDLEHSDDEALINAFSFFNKECQCDASVDVDPETVGQYTGLTDKNGVKIFEGDIVYVPDEEEAGVVAWDDESARFTIELTELLIDFDNYSAIYIEVIGNIYDNPVLRAAVKKSENEE